jgi:3-deoxy-D-manno-octulosonate 8-phosphate phosphatase KdsC-like HAD superfamily phosphatase
MKSTSLPILVTDFDGVMTSQFSLFDESGRSHKLIPVNDSLVVKYLCPLVFSKIVILTAGGNGPGFEITKARVRDLIKFAGPSIEIKLVKCPSILKYRYINKLCDSDRVVYFCDDVSDILTATRRHSNIEHITVPTTAPNILINLADSSIDTSRGGPFFTRACLSYASKEDINAMTDAMLSQSFVYDNLSDYVQEVDV